MVGEQQEDQPQADEKHAGVILHEDDLEVGQKVCVYSLKNSPNEPAQILGQSLEIKAICFPYFVAKLLSDPAEPVLTLDCRFLRLMKVSEDFVKAQQGVKQVTPI